MGVFHEKTQARAGEVTVKCHTVVLARESCLILSLTYYMIFSKALSIYGPQFPPLYNCGGLCDGSNYMHLEDYKREVHWSEIMSRHLEKDERGDV